MRNVKAWAVVDRNGKICFDEGDWRVMSAAIYMRRSIAKERALDGERVVRCTITIDEPKKGGKS